MRIFYAVDDTPNAHFKSTIWRDNLLLPLRDLGHEVVEFRYDLRETFRNLDPSDLHQRAFIRKNRKSLSAELLRQIQAAQANKPIDLFFSYFYDACVLPDAIDEIRSLGIRTVNWYCNGSFQLHLVSEISPHYDWCLVPEKFRIADYHALGARPIYCQEAANPQIYRSFPVERDLDVTFIGQAYGERPAYLHHLVQHGIDLHVWGYGWDRYNSVAACVPKLDLATSLARKVRLLMTREGWQALWQVATQLAKGEAGLSRVDWTAGVVLPASNVGGVLPDDEMIRMFSRSKINLGFSSCGDTHLGGQRILQVRLRDFEIPMSGGFYITEYIEELEEFYKVGKEIVCYRDRDELVDKVKYFLRHESEREAIRRAGYERCQKDHTWHRRFSAAFVEMGIV